MFILTYTLQILMIYVLVAIVPALFLVVYIYRQDKVDKEPVGLIGNLMLQGVFAALVSIVLEMIGEAILPNLISEDNPMYVIVLAFLVVALVEEGSKFFFLRRKTWNNPEFNYRFDGIVYAVSVSLGFAAFENIGYVFRYGLSVAPTRALLSIPGHMGFAVFMGYFYGRAKLYDNIGDHEKAVIFQILGVLSAVFLHGFYDACAMKGTTTATVLFVIFVAAMYFIVFNLVRHESRTDEPV